MARSQTFLPRILAYFLAALLTGLGPAWADGASSRDWTVEKSSGDVFVNTGGGDTFTPLGTTTTLSVGQAVRTGAGGRVMLTRGEEMILISPGSELVLKDESSEEIPHTVIEQRAGAADFRVDRRTAPHFEVQTPYLAALVKGTVFHVAITPGRTRVDVSEGKVQIASNKTGETSLLTAGQAAIVDGAIGGLTLVGRTANSGLTILGVDFSAVRRMFGGDEAVATAVVFGAILGALLALAFAAYHLLLRR